MKADAYLVYMTMANQAEAERIGEIVVRERLAACINILGSVQSMFWWDGAVQSEQETAMTAKTSGARLEALTARVSELHSYDCPCVVAVPIAQGFAPFLKWIDDETSQA